MKTEKDKIENSFPNTPIEDLISLLPVYERDNYLKALQRLRKKMLKIIAKSIG